MLQWICVQRVQFTIVGVWAITSSLPASIHYAQHRHLGVTMKEVEFSN